MSKRKKITGAAAEPAVYRGAVVAVLSLLTLLGFGWAAQVDAGTVAVIAGALATLAPIVQALWTRVVVTPNAKVVARVTTDGRVVAGDASVQPTGADVDRPGPGGRTVVQTTVQPDLVA